MNVGMFLIVAIIKIAITLGVLLTIVAYSVWLERKVVGHMQNRWGPTRVGPFGLLQPLADGIKFILKEDLTPPYVNRTLFILAPMLALVMALTSIALVPIGPNITFGIYHPDADHRGRDGEHQPADIGIGMLIILGITSLGVYGIALAGWSSNSKYSLLGSLRAWAQMISYEVSLGLSLVGVLIISGSFSLRTIVDAATRQSVALEHLWWRRAVRRFLHLSDGGFCRDQPHPVRPAGGGDRTGGRLSHRVQLDEVRHVFHGRVRQHGHRCLHGVGHVSGRMERTCLSGRRSCRRCFRSSGFWRAYSALSFLYIWIRGTLPRFRYDQLMGFGWKFLFPLCNRQHSCYRADCGLAGIMTAGG